MKNIKGLGNDIIEIDRIKKAIDLHGEIFLKRLFTEKEIKYCQKHKNNQERFAGRFAAKEAIIKALKGGGFEKKLSFLDIEILNEENGKPYVKFLKDIPGKILLTISHCKKMACAVAIFFN